jgi:uncharacterized protein
MEDILASIRRIIAEDQSQGLARSGLTGLTRRSIAPEPADARASEPAVEVAETASTDDLPTPVEHETDLHEIARGDVLSSSYEPSEQARAEYHAPDVFPTAEPEHDITTAHADEPAFTQPLFETQQRQEALVPQEPEPEPLVSPVAGASITSSFQALAESVVLGDPGLVERIMRDTMRPLLKDWLDDHLPSIVERLVRGEIERVARGGRSRD